MQYKLRSNLSTIRMIGVSGTSGSPTTITANNNDVLSAGDVGGGQAIFNLRDGSQSNIFVGGTIVSANAADNDASVSFFPPDTNRNQVRLGTDRAGVGADLAFDAVMFCVDGRTADRVIANDVLAQKRNHGSVMTGRVAANGALISGQGNFIVTKGTAGVYTITYRRRDFGQIPLVRVQVLGGATPAGARVSNKSINGCVVTTGVTPTATATDLAFDIFVYGFLAKDSYGRARAPIRCTRRGGRVELYRIEGTSLVFGSSLGTLTVNGTGDFTINHRVPFRTPPQVFCGANLGRVATTDISSTNAATRVRVFVRSSSAATDPTRLDLQVFGFDDPSEY